MKEAVKDRSSERGGAGAKMMFVLLILFMVGNAGYQWIPVAYNGEAFKQEMHAAILQGMALPPTAGSPVDVTKKRLQKAAEANSLPDDTYIEVKQTDKALRARVVYTKHIQIIPFGIYDYEYQFDHTAIPSGFLIQ